jgi:TolB-like protein
MTTVLDSNAGAPAPADIRAAVDRVIASSVFARSPQLGAFLRFVVEAVLHGKADRIKAYTIGVEVLRRDTGFDPQADPIVRVEATRLRRALERYYAGPGAADPIIVDLPRGSYVPTFRRRESDGRATLALTPWLARVRGALPASVRTSPALAAIVGLAVAVLLLLGDAVLYRASRLELTAERTVARAGAAGTPALPAGNGMPIVAIEPLRVLGRPSAQPIAADLLHAKIRDAFARFDTINVVSPVADNAKTTGGAAASAPADEQRPNYRLSGAVDYVGDSANAWFTLTDLAEGNIVWSRTFERVGEPGGRGTSEDGIVITLTNSLLQSYGVIRSRDRARQLASGAGDPRYRCVLEAADAIRTADRREHDQARFCLEQLTALDPGFAVGFTFLGLTYNREFQLGYALRPGDPPPLERALRAVRQSINLHPESSRGYLALMVVQFNRRDIAAAVAAGDKCLALNKYDMLALGEYGGRLILAGDVARGMRMLQDAGAHGAVRPSWHHIYMFLGSYIGDDLAQAAYQAGQIATENVALGQVAKILAYQAAGDREQARRIVERLAAREPAWGKDPKLELSRLIVDPAMVERLARDLAAAGLSGRS